MSGILRFERFACSSPAPTIHSPYPYFGLAFSLQSSPHSSRPVPNSQTPPTPLRSFPNSLFCYWPTQPTSPFLALFLLFPVRIARKLAQNQSGRRHDGLSCLKLKLEACAVSAQLSSGYYVLLVSNVTKLPRRRP